MPPRPAKKGAQPTNNQAKKVDKPEPFQEDESWMRAKQQLKPEDQLDLTADELKEDITRILTTINPQIPDNVVQFSFKEGAFVSLPSPGSTINMINLESNVILKDSDEARRQIILEEGGEVLPIGETTEDMDHDETGEGEEEGEGGGEEEAVEVEEQEPEPEIEEAFVEEPAGEEGGGEGEEGEGGEGEGEEQKGEDAEGDEGDEEGDRPEAHKKAPPPPQSGRKKIMNQFNFCERSTLTYNNPFREGTTQTIPPPRATFSDLCNHWVVFDAYQDDFAAQQREKDKEKKDKPLLTGMKREAKKVETKVCDINSRLLLAAKTIERMINQNTFDDIAQDFRYWDDPSDEYQENEGTLLPLWRFSYEHSKQNYVTGICWNPNHDDLFAVAFGCYDFMRPQPEGVLCLYTLKNPSFPEYAFQTESGITCVDIHKKYTSFICIGMYDGNVAIYNAGIREGGTSKPISKSSPVKTKHGGIVWQICWGLDEQEGEMNMFSVSDDGCVCSWVYNQSGLSRIIVIELFMNSGPINGPDGILVPLRGSGTSIVFHPTDHTIFLVGTEDGKIHKCCTLYAKLLLKTYEAHDLPVHKIDYNKYYPLIFASCSADCKVKIWEDNRSEPLFNIDLGSPVGEVEWAPYSSTVFAAVTDNGRVIVFDINLNKFKSVCNQPVVSEKKNKLTHLAFNYRHPIIVVGDARGGITALKLSPNLRKKEKQPKKGPPLTWKELEVRKLEKLLANIIEPEKLTPPPDVPVQD